MEPYDRDPYAERGPGSTSGDPGSGSYQSSPHDRGQASDERPKRTFEEKVDDVADRFSKVMSEGVKRMEEAFSKGVHDLKQNPTFSQNRIKNFLASSAGGLVLVVAGAIWFFYTIGLLDEPVFPILVIIVGFYIMHRYRSSD